jgi:hypothetical protein
MAKRFQCRSTTNGLLLLSLLAVLGCSSTKSVPRASFREDLRPYGVIIEPDMRTVSYSQVSFLSDEVLLVAVNQERFSQPTFGVDNVEASPTKLLLFDIKKRALIRSAEVSVEKDFDSLQPLSNARFAIREGSEIKICDVTFVCSQPIVVGPGPLVASPRGTTFTAGGHGDSERVLLDSASRRTLGRFPPQNPIVAPGDGTSLICYARTPQLFAKENGKPERALPFNNHGGIIVPDSRFLSDAIIGVSESLETLLVARLDGTSLYRIPVHSWYRGTSIFSSAGGERFGIRESDFTRWNRIAHFDDIENSRTYDFEKIRVLDVGSGKTLLEIERDPRPYIKRLTLPSLSPNGRYLATIYRGFLETYEIP